MKHTLTVPTWHRICDEEHLLPSGQAHRDVCHWGIQCPFHSCKGNQLCAKCKIHLREAQLVAVVFSNAFSSPKAADSELHTLVAILCCEDLYSVAQPIFPLGTYRVCGQHLAVVYNKQDLSISFMSFWQPRKDLSLVWNSQGFADWW